MVVPCNCGLQYVKFLVSGGTQGTDGCYITWSSKAACTTFANPQGQKAVPAPNASTGVGDFAPTGLNNPLIYNPRPRSVRRVRFRSGWAARPMRFAPRRACTSRS